MRPELGIEPILATLMSRFLRAARGRFGDLLVDLLALLVTAPLMAEGWAWRTSGEPPNGCDPTG
jgi:hypothetical protein